MAAEPPPPPPSHRGWCGHRPVAAQWEPTCQQLFLMTKKRKKDDFSWNPSVGEESVTGSGSADAQLPTSSHILEEEPEGGLWGRFLHQDVHHDSPCGFIMCFPVMILRFNALLSAPAASCVHLLPCCAQGRSKVKGSTPVDSSLLYPVAFPAA